MIEDFPERSSEDRDIPEGTLMIEDFPEGSSEFSGIPGFSRGLLRR